MIICVIGGTGKVGSEVVRQLAARGARVRALVHARGAGALPPGVEAVPGDLLDPTSLEPALRGADKLFLLNAVSPDELTQALIVCNLARRTGIAHLVYLSVYDVQRFGDVPHFASKLAVEGALRDFGPAWTVLRPGYYYQNDAGLKDALAAGVYPVPLGPEGIAATDVRDIAAVAAEALTGEGHAGKTYAVVGPEPLSAPGAAAVWSGILGRDIAVPEIDFAGYEAGLRRHLPAWAAFDLRTMFQRYRERGFVPRQEDIARLAGLLGRPPRSYADFARETAARWQAGEGKAGG